MFRTTRVRFSQGTQAPVRSYWYDVDVHGQVFLSGTRIRNFTSCQKDPAFLAVFYNRLRRRPRSERSLVKDEQGAIQGAYAAYPFVSHCGREVNYVRAVDTPLVFTSLTHQGELLYAGLERHGFDPSALKADERGYLYHPSPLSARALALRSSTARRRARRSAGRNLTDSRTEVGEYGFGPYSLMRSSLVLEAFAESLELRDEEEGGGGTIEWQGQRYEIGRLGEGDAWNDQPWNPDSDSDGMGLVQGRER